MSALYWLTAGARVAAFIVLVALVGYQWSWIAAAVLFIAGATFQLGWLRDEARAR